MDIEGLIDFTTLANCKSFSKAAALRHVTQPAFSRRIQALETSVGTALIDRTSRQFKMTPAGDRFLMHAVNMIDLSSRAISDAQSLVTRLHDPVYVTAPSYLSKTFFPAWYKAMQQTIPGLSMRISGKRGSGAIDDLRKGLSDFALVMHTAKLSCYNFDGLQTCVLGQDKIVAVRAKHTKNLDKLLMYEQGSYMNNWADFVLARKKSTHQVIFESSSTGLIKEMALAGFGIAVLPESMVGDDMAQGYLVPVDGAIKLSCDILLVKSGRPAHKKAEKLWAANQRSKP